jgi:glycosidase
MDESLSYWQQMGIDGFRVDMAHMVPMEFWNWVVKRCRARNEKVFFTAEAYENDPMKLSDSHVLDALLEAGFDSVYDDPSYDVLEGIYESGKWANDLDPLTFTGNRFHRSLRYAENHDEIRLANPKRWGGLGMRVGKPVSAVLFSMGRGPVMIYHGQEFGEPAVGAEGFGADDARTSIFDYGSMPEFVKWVNGGSFDGAMLGPEQKAMRAWYSKLLKVVQAPAFTRGEFYGLNHFNKENPHFGRVGDVTSSGHWIYAFLRHDEQSGQSFLVIANFHGTETLRDVRIRIPRDAHRFLGRDDQKTWIFSEQLEKKWEGQIDGKLLDSQGLLIPDMPPTSALFLGIGK